MNKTVLKQGLGGGVLLWLIGYLLGFAAFMVVPVEYIGWVVTPIGIMITLWVLFKKIDYSVLKDYAMLGLVWVVVAVILDFVFLVQLLKPEDGYYKPDVYLYYLFTLGLPILVGWWKTNKSEEKELVQ